MSDDLCGDDDGDDDDWCVVVVVVDKVEMIFVQCVVMISNSCMPNKIELAMKVTHTNGHNELPFMEAVAGTMK